MSTNSWDPEMLDKIYGKNRKQCKTCLSIFSGEICKSCTVESEIDENNKETVKENKFDFNSIENSFSFDKVSKLPSFLSSQLKNKNIEINPPEFIKDIVNYFQFHYISEENLSKSYSFEVYIFGSGDCGQLGLGNEKLESNSPLFLMKKSVSNVSCGGMHSLILDNSDNLYTWGCNDNFALGREGVENIYLPVDIPINRKIIKIEAGDSFSAILFDNSTVYICGLFSDSSGTLGVSKVSKINHIFKMVEFPMNIFNKNDKIIDIAAGDNHLVMLTTKGLVYGIGDTEFGQLGCIVPNRFKSNSLIPRRIAFPRFKKGIKIVRIFCGGYHNFALTNNNKIYSWGLNNYGQLGFKVNHNSYNQILPKLVPFDSLQKIKDLIPKYGHEICIISNIVCSMHSTMILTKSGHIFSFGRNDFGQLGVDIGKSRYSENFLLVDCPRSVLLISLGSYHGMALTEDYEIYSWGYGEMGQLGHGYDKDEPFPKLIKFFNDLKNQNKFPVYISSGGQHSIVVVWNGSNIS